MLSYEMMYIITTPISLITLREFFRFFLGEQTYSKKIEILSYITFGVLMTIFYFNIKTPILLLLFNLFCFFLISFNYNCKFIRKIVSVFVIYILLMTIEAIVWAFTCYGVVYLTEEVPYSSTLGIVIIRVLGLVISHFMGKVKKTNNEEISMPVYYYLAQLVVLLGLLYLFLIATSGEGVKTSELIISSCILILVCTIIIIVDEKVYKTIIITTENNLLKQQNIAYENEVEIVNSSIEAIKGVKHDIKNHILILDAIYKNKQFDEFEGYIQKILKEIDNEKKIVNSNNFIVDSIVNLKLKGLVDDRIEIVTNVKIPNKINILAFDLNVLLSNLLDNAITAIRETEGKAKLNIYMHCVKGSLIIIIDNTYNGVISAKNGNLLTTKKIKDEHGIGIKNIKKMVEQYNGDIDIRYTDKTFSVEILIPNIV